MPEQREADREQHGALWKPLASRDRPAEVLLVCTANVCRSPAAEAFLRHHLAEAGSPVVVHSAGTRATSRRVDPTVAKLLRSHGVRVRRRRGAALTQDRLSNADLVVAMARENADEIELISPESRPCLFTLKELVRQGQTVGGRAPDETLESWVARLHGARVHMGMGKLSLQDDVVDPFGRSAALYEEMADEVDALTRQLAVLIVGSGISHAGMGETPSAVKLEAQPDFDAPRPDLYEDSDNEDRRELAEECDDAVGAHEDVIQKVDGGTAGGTLNDRTGNDQSGNEDTEEPSMSLEDVTTVIGSPRAGPSPADPSNEVLRLAREALDDAQETVMEAAQQLADVLAGVTPAAAPVPTDDYTAIGEEVAALLRDASAHAAVVRQDADRYAERTGQQADRDAHTLREQAQKDAADLRRRASEESATVRREAEDAAAASAAAVEVVNAARVRYSDLVVAESDLRKRLEAAAGALVTALDGPRAIGLPTLALGAANEDEGDGGQ